VVPNPTPVPGHAASTNARNLPGAITVNRPDWHAHLTDLPLRSLLAGIAAGGMRGLVVDRFGYTDGGGALVAEPVA